MESGEAGRKVKMHIRHAQQKIKREVDGNYTILSQKNGVRPNRGMGNSADNAAFKFYFSVCRAHVPAAARK